MFSEEPFIPWELLYCHRLEGRPSRGKGFLGEWGLVRWLLGTPLPGRRLVLRDDRVHHVVPDYLDPKLKLDGAAQERGMLQRLFAKAEAVPADSVEVAQFLSGGAETCDLLHFACHGEAEQLAVLSADLLMTGTKVNNGYAADLLSSDMVRAHARFAETEPRPIVFINACQTGRAGAGLAAVGGFASAFLAPISERGAGAFIGALWSVDDSLALTFAEKFYDALKGGKTLVEATRAAREAAKSNQEFTWLAYSVYGHPFARVVETHEAP